MNDHPESQEKLDFQKAATKAYEEFGKFAKRLRKMEDYLAQPSAKDRPKLSANERALEIHKFIEDIHECTVMRISNKLPQGYASWLYFMGDEQKFKIVYDTSRIDAWVQEQMRAISDAPDESVSKLLADVQTTRSLLHELGHRLLADDLIANLRQTPPGSAKAWANIEEEQKAWMFAFCFLGLLLSRYTGEVRMRNNHCDDAPRIIL